jgi:hypothetical protein
LLVKQHTELLLRDVALARQARACIADRGRLVLLALHGACARGAEASELCLDTRRVRAEGGVQECLHGACNRGGRGCPRMELHLQAIVVLLETLVDETRVCLGQRLGLWCHGALLGPAQGDVVSA